MVRFCSSVRIEVTDKSGAAGRAVAVPVFGGNALPFPLRLLPLHLRDPRIMEWLHHLPEGVNLSTKLSDQALELWRCTWVGQVMLGGMASISFSDVLHGRFLGYVSACSALTE